MRYLVAKDSRNAVALMGAGGHGRWLAGGTDLLVQMKLGDTPPDFVVDIKQIPAISDIVSENGGFRVGACVSGAEMGEHPALKAHFPGVVEAVELIGSTQVQGRATMVGNLCNGSPAADSVPAMLAVGAVACVQGPNGQRDVPVADMLEGPGRTKLAAADLVTSIFLPTPPARSSDAYLRFIPRTEMDIAVASAAVSLCLDKSGAVMAAQVALGAVAPTAILVDASALIGSHLQPDALAALAAACSAACSPIDDKRGSIEYRTRIAGVMATRAAKTAYSRAGGQL